MSERGPLTTFLSPTRKSRHDVRASACQAGCLLHQYANLYIDARNAMLFRRQAEHLDLCVLRVSTDVLDLADVVIADRNAAADLVRFSPAPQGLALIDRELVFADWWNGSVEAKQVRCAEVLVPGEVPPRFLLGAYVSCEEARQRVA